MSSLSKAFREKADKDVAARAKTVVQTGLPARPSRVDVLALARKLEELAKTPAAQATRLHEVFERSARVGAPLERFACRMGCAYCCHGMVAITAPEAFALAERVCAGGADAITRFREGSAKTAGKTASERLGARLPCPLLEGDGACSAYTRRPLACRRVVAFEIEPCIDEFEGQDGEIEVPAHYEAHAANAVMALASATAAIGRPLAHYELGSAVLAVLDTPDAEARWRRGEDIFAHLRVEDVGLDIDAAISALGD